MNYSEHRQSQATAKNYQCTRLILENSLVIFVTKHLQNVHMYVSNVLLIIHENS